MNRAVVYYILKNRLRDRTFWLFELAGLTIFAVFLVSMRGGPNALPLFANGIGPLFLIYSSIVSGVNGLGKDRGRGYLEILLTRPVSLPALAAGYYSAHVLLSVAVYGLTYPPALILWGKGASLSPDLMIVLPLTTIALFSAYSILFSLLANENAFITMAFLMIILCFAIPMVAPRLTPLLRIAWPVGPLGKIAVTMVLLGSSWVLSKRKPALLTAT